MSSWSLTSDALDSGPDADNGEWSGNAAYTPGGSIVVTASGTMLNGSDGSIDNESGGTIGIDSGGALTVDGGATLTNEGGGLLDNFGTITVTSSGSLVNEGELINENSPWWSDAGYSGYQFYNSTINNSGSLVNSGSFVNGGNVVNNGSLSSGSLENDNTLTNTVNGVLDVTGSFDNAGYLNNYGSVTDEAGSELSNTNTVTNYGSISIAGSTSNDGSWTNVAATAGFDSESYVATDPSTSSITLNGDSPWSISFWSYYNGAPATATRFVCFTDGDGNTGGIYFGNTGVEYGLFGSWGTADSDVAVGVGWHNVVLTYAGDGGSTYLYVDNVEACSTSMPFPSGTLGLEVGYDVNYGGYYFDCVSQT